MGFFDNLLQASSTSPLVALTKKQNVIGSSSQTQVPFGNTRKVGGNASYIDEGDKIDNSITTQYIYPTASGVGSEIIISTKKEMSSGSDVAQASEKGFGGLGSTASGEGATASSVSGSSNILTYALIGAGVLGALYIVKMWGQNGNK